MITCHSHEKFLAGQFKAFIFANSPGKQGKEPAKIPGSDVFIESYTIFHAESEFQLCAKKFGPESCQIWQKWPKIYLTIKLVSFKNVVR